MWICGPDKMQQGMSPLLNGPQMVNLFADGRYQSYRKATLAVQRAFSILNLTQNYMVYDTCRPAVISSHQLLWLVSSHLGWKQLYCRSFLALTYTWSNNKIPDKLEQRMRKWPFKWSTDLHFSGLVPAWQPYYRRELHKDNLEFVFQVLVKWESQPFPAGRHF